MISNFIKYLTAEKQYSKLTVRAYGDDIRQFLLFYGVEDEAEFVPGNITHIDIRSWIMSLSDEGVAVSSINRKLSSLRALYRYLNRQGIITTNPTNKIHSLKSGRRVVNVVGVKQMVLFGAMTLDVTDDFITERDSLIILLFYSTGIRLAELIGIKIDDISYDCSEIRITGKGDKQRIVMIPSVLKNKLENYLKIRSQICDLQEKSLFLSNKFKPISRSVVYTLVRDTLRSLGLKGKCSPHVLRHTFATHLLNEGVGIETVKSMLGHASLRSTQIYTHSSISQLIETYKDTHPWAKR